VGGTLISGSESTNAALTVPLYLISGSIQIFLQITGYLKIKVQKKMRGGETRKMLLWPYVKEVMRNRRK
jgi:hypothetical protein